MPPRGFGAERPACSAFGLRARVPPSACFASAGARRHRAVTYDTALSRPFAASRASSRKQAVERRERAVRSEPRREPCDDGGDRTGRRVERRWARSWRATSDRAVTKKCVRTRSWRATPRERCDDGLECRAARCSESGLCARGRRQSGPLLTTAPIPEPLARVVLRRWSRSVRRPEWSCAAAISRSVRRCW